MKQKQIALCLALSLLLTGCSWPGGRYVSVKAHQTPHQNVQKDGVSADNYNELVQALEEMVRAGTENLVIDVREYPAEKVENAMKTAVRYTMSSFPLGAYAVEDIAFEQGTRGGLPALAVTVTYRHGRGEIQKIRRVKDLIKLEVLVIQALQSYDTNLVVQVEQYREADFQQMVRDYAQTHPETVMETPVVTENIYGKGEGRVVELSFSYQNGRDSMRQMQSQVKPVFDAAKLYVSGGGGQRRKFSQLYAFLMERFDYTIETSITPSYSLLQHGVGDSRAFATVYGAMCREAGLECLVVTGTRAGEPWVWNIVLVDGNYQHVDLLRCNEIGRYRELSDRDMEGYVWDYSAYPECPLVRIQEVEPLTDEEQTPAPGETLSGQTGE